MRVDCGFKGHERNASIFIGFPLQMARNQFEGNLTWVRIPPAAPKIRPSAFGRWSYFWVPLPVVAPPQGNRTCSGQVNCPCAKILLRKILVTAHPRRLAVWEHGSVGVHTAASWPDGTGLTLALPHYSNILRFCYRCPKPLYFAKNWGILASGRRGDRMEDYTRKFNAAKEKDEDCLLYTSDAADEL